MCRSTSVMSESPKNASGQEAFRHKGRRASVEHPPAASVADCSSQASTAGGLAAPEVEKVAADNAQQAEGLQSGLCMSTSLPAQDHEVVEVGGPGNMEEDDKCLYVGTPWEDEVIAETLGKCSSLILLVFSFCLDRAKVLMLDGPFCAAVSRRASAGRGTPSEGGCQCPRRGSRG
jgi:hypothetical protein